MEQTVPSTSDNPEVQEYDAATLLTWPKAQLHKMTYPRRVVGLDTETMALQPNAAVLEVGLVSTVFAVKFPEKAQEVVDARDVSLVRSAPVKFHFIFNVVDQIARGRALDSTTYRWHVNKMGFSELQSVLTTGLAFDEQATLAMLAQMHRYLKNIDEIWINGLSFDPAILTSLAQSYGYITENATGALWDFQKERDTRTIYRTFPLSANKTDATHRALPDAQWCLEQAWVYHKGCHQFGNMLLPERQPPAEPVDEVEGTPNEITLDLYVPPKSTEIEVVGPPSVEVPMDTVLDTAPSETEAPTE